MPESQTTYIPQCGVIENSARIVRSGDRTAIEVVLETSITDERKLRLLLSEALAATSRAECDIWCMNEDETHRRFKALIENDRLNKLYGMYGAS